MTPHIWKCDPHLVQTIIVDFVDAKELNVDALDVSVTLLNSKPTAQNYSIQLKASSLKTFEIARLDFNLPEDIQPGAYTLKLSAKSKSSSYYFSSALTNIQCQKPDYGVYILTDKPVYRDSDLVQIRIVHIDSDLMPSERTASIYIYDPNKNRIQQFLDVNFERGLINGLELQLTDRPMYGQWTIKVVVGGTTNEASFTVKEYVLPKFEFTLDIPPYILKSSKSFDGSVEAKYTYGKPLEGDVNVTVKHSFWTCQDGSKEESAFQQIFKLTNGKLIFTVPLLKISNDYWNYKLVVTVTDKYSKEIQTKETNFNFVDVEFYIKDHTTDFVKNQWNRFDITLYERNDKPYSKRKLYLLVTQNFDTTNLKRKSAVNDIGKFEVVTDDQGRIGFDVNVSNITANINIQISLVSDLNQTQSFNLNPKVEKPTPIFTTTNGSNRKKLDVSIKKPLNVVLTIGTTLTLKITRNSKDSTSKCVNARYLVLSKLEVLEEGLTEVCDEASIDIELTSFHAPQSTFMVYTVDADWNVDVAQMDINIPNFYRNHLDIALGNSETVKPGDVVEIGLSTNPKSLVAISIIDKSVKLMGNVNELTTNKINSLATGSRLYSYGELPPASMLEVPSVDILATLGWNLAWQKLPALQALNDCGLAVASDLRSLGATIVKSSPIFRFGGGHAHMAISAFSDSGESSMPAPQTAKKSLMPTQEATESVQIRSDFRETWIWETVSFGNESMKSIESKIPETITSWVASGISLNSDFGIALADEKEITTLKEFFVSSFLPPSMIRGEILRLQVAVFNYMNRDLTNVTVKLAQSDDFHIVQDGQLSTKKSDWRKNVDRVEAQSSKIVEFFISPVNIGQLKVSTQAVSSVAGDGEVKMLKVKPEGIQKFSTQSLLITHSGDDSDSATSKDFSISFPSNAVKNSMFCSIQVIGDILGPTMNNLRNLINKPYGCGEQNMVTLVPNIYALDYLSAVKASDSDISNIKSFEQSAEQNILDGYQRQLSYALSDGSFSSFGQHDRVGSTWLTAFVVKSFIDAQRHAPQIDDGVIRKAISFLVDQQDDSGVFVENGRVWNTNIQGGVNSKQLITAYVTSALIEASSNDSSVIHAINLAISYLEGEIVSIDDPFALGLVTYALDLGKSKQANKYLEKFESMSLETEDGDTYWSQSSDETMSNNVVELTSYGLLMSLRHQSVSDAAPIARYLISKLNSHGGFSNTQDTVLGLQALTQFALKALLSASSSRNLQIKVSFDDDDSDFDHTFTVNDKNSLILQTLQLHKCPQSVHVEVTSGSVGSALVQLVSSYNVLNLASHANIRVNQSTVSVSDYGVKVLTCAINTGVEATGMTLIEAQLLSGYEVERAEMDQLLNEVPQLRLVEMPTEAGQDRVVFYLQSLESDKQICIDWTMHKSHEVTNLKSVSVQVYDYYNNDLDASFSYQPPKAKQNALALRYFRKFRDLY